MYQCLIKQIKTMEYQGKKKEKEKTAPFCVSVCVFVFLYFVAAVINLLT